ncbi:interleukin 2 receptor, gamma a isoform X2 [Alosa sapidissima]|uniref:interleukin 2 receptor, gamma a isoform X2 n=1 Tax=Alosa sapidissima TaxID=34773 RepID=UPI001C08538C|nr:interleukin 2 receptor, gamma a isoform X2 [Alosa sapidissima]
MTRMLPLLHLLLVLPWSVCASAPPTEVSCYVVNLDYINCTWNQPKAPDLSYTLFANYTGYALVECPQYLVGDKGLRVGCRLPYSEPERFQTLETSLRRSGNLSIHKQHKLKDTVKLNPPTNLKLRWRQKALSLSWDVRAGYKRFECIESRVQYGLNDKWLSPTKLSPGEKSFLMEYPSNSSTHTFRVQVRLHGCGSSAWSEWSPVVVWGNRTDSKRAPPAMSWVSLMLYMSVAAVILILLTCLLVHNERLRVTLIPVVPNPGKNLTELMDTYNGNVEKWLRISKELQEGFKPTFTERPYAVREYRLVGQSSVESDSGVSLSSSSTSSSTTSSTTSSSTSFSTLPHSSTSSTDGSC